MPDLLTMLTYGRPEGSRHQQRFNRRFIEPVFGPPDEHGNYVLVVGADPLSIAFMAHHDTVHQQSQRQKIEVTNGIAHLPTNSNSSCLGADCTTGVWLILEMIEAQVPATYVIHAGEEIGCVGSSLLAPDLGPSLNFAISFDRMGTNSVITHQMGMRTASNAFVKSFVEATGLVDYEADGGGSYTDSNEYAPFTPECTNISVGYQHQHTKREVQDIGHAMFLRDHLLNARWEKLEAHRDPSRIDRLGWLYGTPSIEELVTDNPTEVALILKDLGYDARTLEGEIEAQIYRQAWEYN